MTPLAIMEQVAGDGVRLALSPNGTIKAIGDQKAVNRWLPIIRNNKPGIVAALQESVNVIIEPSLPGAKPIYWESMDGTWHGPVKPEYLGRTGKGSNEQFWVIVNHKGTFRWIWTDLLRSRQAFLARMGNGRVMSTNEPKVGKLIPATC